MARNIRFSNDSKEYKIGQKIIEKYIKLYGELEEECVDRILAQMEEKTMMYYMVCFCEEGDLLSQWRGYAKDGVSIGFDFTGGIVDVKKMPKHIEYFSVLNNSLTQHALEEKYMIGNRPLLFAQMPYRVQYVKQEEEVALGECAFPKKIKRVLDEIKKKGRNGEQIFRLLEYVPFLKDEGFAEERECRLIYNMEFIGETKAQSWVMRNKKIDYLDSEGIKKPYIRVAFGNAKNKEREVKRVVLGVDATEFGRYLLREETHDKCKIIGGEACKGIWIGEGNNQEEIMKWLEECIGRWEIAEGKKSDIKIWCEGHLPIRKIIVGPGEKQMDLKESLEHYKESIYWLRYIEVGTSKIPLKN